jgi:histidyl-tRNA synthetase
MTEKKQIYKPRPISGFPEWLPEERLVEQKWLDHIRRVFESYGYCSIETPAVEELNVIAAKGEDVDKEIYVLERLHKQEGDKEARLALHFDQTVPFARYVAQNFNELVYPFKRYQMQKVWRGERPQMGRMREFYQCDIDVINPDNLPLSFDAECAAVMYEVLTGLPCIENGPLKVQLKISNRKILLGLIQVLEIKNSTEVLSWIDKFEKIGEEQVRANIKFYCDNDANKVAALLQFSKFKACGPQAGLEIRNLISSYSFSNDLMFEGAKELADTMDALSHLPEDAVVADLSIVRGLDYYTGTVYETQLLDVPEFTGSVCSGGRYDDLAGSYINKHLPGVGISIGFSRLFDVMRQTKRLKIGAKSPTQILVLLLEETQRVAANAKGRELREQGFNVEVFHAPSKIDKQFKYAEKKGIPFIYMPMDNDGKLWEIKNSETRTQKPEAEGLKDLQKVRA